MDCATGILIDLDKSQYLVEQELSENAAVPNDFEESPMLETLENFILNKQLCDVDGKTDPSSPVCGVLIDLDFNGTAPLNENDSSEAVMQSFVQIKVQDCESARFAEKNNDLTLNERSSSKSSNFLKKGSSSSSSGSSRNGVNFSWSPSVIYKDVDLLENEKFDFNLSMSSISPYRENEVFSIEENVCKKCSCKDKPPKLSTPQKDWSLLNAAFISEISEEASKVVTHLSTKKKPLQKSAVCESQLPSLSLNSSLLVSQHSDSGIEEQDCNFNDDEILECTSFKSQTDCNPPVCSKERNNSFVQTEKNESVTEVNKRTIILENTCENTYDGIISNLNAIQIGANISQEVNPKNIVNIENKENIPLSPEEAETSVFSDYSNITEVPNYTVNSEEFTLDKKPSPEQKDKSLDHSFSSKESSSLIRRETFTVKSSPLQASNGSVLKNKKINISNEGSGVGLKETKKKSFYTPKSSVNKLQQNASSNKIVLSSMSKVPDSPDPHISLMRKSTYTISPSGSSRNGITLKSHGSSARSNCSTPNKVSKISPVAGKAKTCAAIAKSRLESSPACASSPKVSAAGGFKTPTLPKRTSVVPARLSYSQSRAVVSTNTRAGTSVQQSSLKVTRTNSFQLPNSAAMTGLANKRPAQATKPRASSASAITDTGLSKKTLPIKAIAPLSNMVKPSAVAKPNGEDGILNVSASKEKNTTPATSRGVVSGRISAVVKSEQAKRSSSLSTPKSISTPSKPRFLSESGTPTRPVSLKKDPGIRRLSFVPTPKRFTPKQCSEKF